MSTSQLGPKDKWGCYIETPQWITDPFLAFRTAELAGTLHVDAIKPIANRRPSATRIDTGNDCPVVDVHGRVGVGRTGRHSAESE